MAAIEGIVYDGIDTCPYALVRLLTTSGVCVSEQTAGPDGAFSFVVPTGLWGLEAVAGDQRVAVRDVLAAQGERMPVYVCLDSGERRVFGRTRSPSPDEANHVIVLPDAAPSEQTSV